MLGIFNNIGNFFWQDHSIEPAENKDSCTNKLSNLTNTLERREDFSLNKLIGNNQVILFGEWHSNPQSKNFIRQNLLRLKDAGVSCLGLEYLPDDLQPDLDNQDFSRVGPYLQNNWRYKQNGNAYLDLCIEARRLGIRILALDINSKESEQIKSAYKNQITEAHLQRQIVRNRHMTETINSFLQANPGQKIACLTGGLHIQENIDSIPTRLRSINPSISYTTAYLSGGINFSKETASKVQREQDPIASLASDNNLGQELFMINTNNHERLRLPYQWLIHLPQAK